MALFLTAFVGCLALVGLLIPGTSLLIALGILAGQGLLTFVDSVLLICAGALSADLVSYFLGRHFQHRIRQMPWLRSHPEWLDKAEGYVHKYGWLGIIAGRFIAPLRPTLPLVAGTLEMPFLGFFGASILAALCWALAYMLPGWNTGAALRQALSDGFWAQVTAVAVPLAALIVIGMHQMLRNRPKAPRTIAILAGVALLALLLGLPYLQTLDQELSLAAHQAQGRQSYPWFVFTTSLGDAQGQLWAGLLLLLVLLLTRQIKALLFAGGTLLSTQLANSLIKHLVQRARPEVLQEPLASFSFPSGHSSAAFAFFLTLGVLAGRGRAPGIRLTWLLMACIPAALVALSRVYLGAHWPTDILAGALLAGTFCGICLTLSERYAPWPPLPKRSWQLLLSVCTLWLLLHAAWVQPEALQHNQSRTNPFTTTDPR